MCETIQIILDFSRILLHLSVLFHLSETEFGLVIESRFQKLLQYALREAVQGHSCVLTECEITCILENSGLATIFSLQEKFSLIFIITHNFLRYK